MNPLAMAETLAALVNEMIKRQEVTNDHLKAIREQNFYIATLCRDFFKEMLYRCETAEDAESAATCPAEPPADGSTISPEA